MGNYYLIEIFLVAEGPDSEEITEAANVRVTVLESGGRETHCELSLQGHNGL